MTSDPIQQTVQLTQPVPEPIESEAPHMVISRPFLEMYGLIEKLEFMRRKRQLPDNRHQMTLTVVQLTGEHQFLKHARNVHSMREIAKFYGTDLSCNDNLYLLLSQIGNNETHSECFYYAFYFAAWVKQEVPKSSRIFGQYDEKIWQRIERGGSLQSILVDIVAVIGYLKFRRYFDAMGINRVHLFLENLQVRSIDDLANLDDVECRHILDQIIMKTNLKQMKLCEVQKALGQDLLSTDQDLWLNELSCNLEN